MNKERIKEIEAILTPEPYNPTIEETVLAKVRCEIEDMPALLLGYYAQLLVNKPEVAELAKTSSAIKELIDNITKGYNEMEEWYETDIADHIKHYDWIPNGLGAMHMGDCTRIPAGCLRCAAEAYYKIPDTALPIAEGTRLVYELMRLEKEENNE